MRRLLRWTPVVLGALAMLSLVAAWTLDRFVAREVQILVPAAPEEVALNRTLWAPGDPVAAIYGVPAGPPLRVLFVAAERIVRPVEAPELALLPVDKQAGENPLQVRTVWFLAWRAAAGLGLGAIAVAGLAAWLGLRRRRRRGAAPGPIVGGAPSPALPGSPTHLGAPKRSGD